MAYVITIAQRKGGAGKTTLACQLAAALAAKQIRVAGADLDEQQSFALWAHVRAANRDADPFFAGVFEKRIGLSSAVRRSRGLADVLIVDTPPTADYDVRRAIGAANLVMAPMQLSPIDLAASLPTAEAIGAAGKSALFVVNRAPAKSRIAAEIRIQIDKYRLPVARTELGNRTAYAETMGVGAGVVEAAPRSAAAAEIRALTAELFAIAGQFRKAA